MGMQQMLVGAGGSVKQSVIATGTFRDGTDTQTNVPLALADDGTTSFSSYVNTSTGAVTTANVYPNWQPGPVTVTYNPAITVSSSGKLRVYAGAFSNTARTTTVTITYADDTTDYINKTTSLNNWIFLYEFTGITQDVKKIVFSINTGAYMTIGPAARSDGVWIVEGGDVP